MTPVDRTQRNLTTGRASDFMCSGFEKGGMGGLLVQMDCPGLGGRNGQGRSRELCHKQWNWGHPGGRGCEQWSSKHPGERRSERWAEWESLVAHQLAHLLLQ